MKRHGGNLPEHYKVREANLKNIHIVRFQLYDIQEKAELETIKTSAVTKGWWWMNRSSNEEILGQ